MFGGATDTFVERWPDGKCPKIEISFAYQKYPTASPRNGKSDGYNNNLIDKIILCRSGYIFGNDSKSFLNEINLKDIPDTINYYLKSSFQLDNDVIEHWVANN